MAPPTAIGLGNDAKREKAAPSPTSPVSIATLLDSPMPTLCCEEKAPHKIIALNPAWMAVCGYEPGEAVGLPPSLLLQSGKTNKLAASAFTRALLTGDSATVRLTNRTKQGAEFKHTLLGERVEVFSPGGGSSMVFLARSSNVEPIAAIVSRPPRPYRLLLRALGLVLVLALSGLMVPTGRLHDGGIEREAKPGPGLPHVPSILRPVLMQLRLYSHTPHRVAALQVPRQSKAHVAVGDAPQRPPSRRPPLRERLGRAQDAVGRAMRSMVAPLGFLSITTALNLDLLLLSAAPILLPGM